jgi:LysR family transcriptional activator of nhaA
MEWLNYHHLLYFWTVARTGSVAAASTELRLAAPTISNQIRKLEDSLGEKLFKRSGRGLVLTDMGRVAMSYADDIFALGREFSDAMKDRPTGRPLRLSVGISDVVPKLIAYKILEPALKLDRPVRIICREDRPERLLANLALHDFDVVLSDSPASSIGNIPAFSHLLGECGVSFFASKAFPLQPGRFPKLLNGAKFLAPTDNSAFRRRLDEWFITHNVRPVIVGEFQDVALLRSFAERGFGIFAAPSVLDAQLREYGFKQLGKTDEIRARFYALTVERKLQHPAVAAVCETAKNKLFS